MATPGVGHRSCGAECLRGEIESVGGHDRETARTLSTADEDLPVPEKDGPRPGPRCPQVIDCLSPGSADVADLGRVQRHGGVILTPDDQDLPVEKGQGFMVLSLEAHTAPQDPGARHRAYPPS